MSNLFPSPMSSANHRRAGRPGRLAPPGPTPPYLPGPLPTEAPTVRGHHARRIEAVLDHIEQHLSEGLSLEALAERAAISPFHFHRLFQAWTGETLNRCVRRLRLESAAGRLRHCPDEKITVISLNCGFASPESFARAFREHFGMTPSQWRSGGWANWRHVAGVRGTPQPCRIEVKRHEEADYLFMRARGDYAATSADLWGRFLPWVHGMGLGDQPLLCIGLDDPAITEPALCRMDACVQLPPAWQDPGLRLPRHHFPARWVATLHYDGPASGIGQGWHTLLNEWLPHAPFDMGEGHFFQRYDPRDGVPDSPLVRCELCMPVQPRTS